MIPGVSIKVIPSTSNSILPKVVPLNGDSMLVVCALPSLLLIKLLTILVLPTLVIPTIGIRLIFSSCKE